MQHHELLQEYAQADRCRMIAETVTLGSAISKA
jgi:hypothetical protein